MHRILLVAALAVGALALPSVASAAQPPAEPTIPPAFAPPAPAPVTDVASAEDFAKGYASENARTLLGERRRNRVRVIDANAACLEHPVVALRFGCVFTLRALVISKRNGWDDWGHHSSKSSKSHRGHHPRKPKFRIRTFGCLGLLSVTGGPAPTAQLRFSECARVRNGDMVAPEPVL